MSVPWEVKLTRHEGDLDDAGHDTYAVDAYLFPPATDALSGSFNLGGGYAEAGTGVTVEAGHLYRITLLGWNGVGTSNMGVAFGASGVSGSDAWHTAPTFDMTVPVVGTNMRLIGRNSGGNLVGTGWTYQDLGDIPNTGEVLGYDGSGTAWVSAAAGAPTAADYLVGTTQAGLSAEIVVGTTPGGELGGTWSSPTVDTTHSGSSHAAAQAAAEATAAAALAAHVAAGGGGGGGEILISDTPSTPLVFADLIQNEAQDDLVYADA
jgi:hypothetical protein